MSDGNKKGVVWFNGPSAVDLHHIKTQPLEIGCNFIESRRKVNHVCAYDGPTIKALNEKKLTTGVKYWTRKPFQNEPWNLVESKLSNGEFKHHTGFCSGTLALSLAIQLGCTEILLLGLDWKETNRSIFDDDYVWRKNHPEKHNLHKLNFLRKISEVADLTVVHKRPKNFGNRIKWINPADFLDSI